jgi:predicted dehydrogenase
LNHAKLFEAPTPAADATIEDERMNATSGKPIRVGIVGITAQGMSWGASAHLPALRALPRFQVTALATTRQETADAAGKHFNIAKAYGDWKKLCADPEVDVVSVCVRVPAHHDIVAAAIAGGKHVYCEWPLDVDAKTAAQLSAVAKAKGVIGMVGLQGRLIPALSYAKDLIAKGEIGDVLGASLSMSTLWPMAMPAGLTYLHTQGSGASFHTISSGHAVDALRYAVGEFTALSGYVGVMRPNMQKIEAGGVMAPFTRTSADQIALAGLIGAVPVTIRSAGNPTMGTGFKLEINGSKTNLVLTVAPTMGYQMGDLTLSRTEAKTGVLEAIEVPAAYSIPEAADLRGPPMAVALMYARLAEAIDGGRPVPASFDDAVRFHKVLEAVETAGHRAAPL